MSFNLDDIKNLNKEEKAKLFEYLKNEHAHEVYEKNLEVIKENKKYIGKCFKSKHSEKYLIVLDSRSTNEFHFECFTFSFPIKIDKTHPYLRKLFSPDSCFGHLTMNNFQIEDIGLLCFSFKKSGLRINAEYEEITEERFLEKFNQFTAELKTVIAKIVEENRKDDNND